MPVSSSRNAADETLATALVMAYAASGGAKPVLPAGRRGDVVDLLTGLMIDRERLELYATLLEVEQERQGLRDVLLQQSGLEIRDAQIAAEGFGGLADDELADIALSPNAIFAIEEYLDDPERECGDWLVRRILEDEAARPDAAERDRRAEDIYRGLQGAGLLGPEERSAIPFEGRNDRARDGRTFLRWGAGFLALAASLVVGVFIGGTVLKNGARVPGALLATATVAFEGGRGGNQGIPRLKVGSSFKGFVTVIALLPGAPDRPVVFPIMPSQDLAIGPDNPTDTGLFPKDARTAKAALVVVTKTPAADTLEKRLRDEKFAADRLGDLEAAVREALEATGHDQIAITRVALDPSNQR